MAGYVDVPEAEKISGLDERTLRRYAKRGKLKRYRSGLSRIMYRKADLLALIQPKEETPQGGSATVPAA